MKFGKFWRYPLKAVYLPFYVSKFQVSSSNGVEMAAIWSQGVKIEILPLREFFKSFNSIIFTSTEYCFETVWVWRLQIGPICFVFKKLKNSKTLGQFAASKLKLFQNNTQWKWKSWRWNFKKISARDKISIFIPWL